MYELHICSYLSSCMKFQDATSPVSSLHASRSKHFTRWLQAELGRSLADLGLNAATGRDARNWTKIEMNLEFFVDFNIIILSNDKWLYHYFTLFLYVCIYVFYSVLLFHYMLLQCCCILLMFILVIHVNCGVCWQSLLAIWHYCTCCMIPMST